MKTLLFTLSLIALLNSQAQNKILCDTPYVSYSTLSHTVCIPNTYNVNASFTQSLHITGTGATSYTWNVNGVDSVFTSYFNYVPTEAGTTTVVITGMNICRSTSTSTIILIAVVCDYSSTPTGIIEQKLNPTACIYFDLQGNQIEKRFDELIIEQIGLRACLNFIQ